MGKARRATIFKVLFASANLSHEDKLFSLSTGLILKYIETQRAQKASRLKVLTWSS
jgi:hypothetical protein